MKQTIHSKTTHFAFRNFTCFSLIQCQIKIFEVNNTLLLRNNLQYSNLYLEGSVVLALKLVVCFKAV